MASFLKIVILTLSSIFVIALTGKAQENFDLINFDTQDGGKIEAAFFSANSTKVVIFAHGAVFSKESWYFLCEQLQVLNIAALSLDFRGYGQSKAGKSSNKSLDILAADEWLQTKGFTEISLVGGSMGGAAMLAALPEVSALVSKVVLLAPAGGQPIKSVEIDKLFIVSTDEGLYPRVEQIYTQSVQPKKLKEFAGTAHAQHMFKEAYAAALTELILAFLKEE